MNLKEIFNNVQNLRDFKSKDYLEEKSKAINDFFREENLDSCVVGLSGGIDSALVLKLLLHASDYPGSPIKQIRGLFLPIYTDGITGQDAAEVRVKDLVDPLLKEDTPVFDYRKYDLTKSVEGLLSCYPNNMTKWTKGQAACIVRTPALYGDVALLQQYRYKSIVVGTTNKDEGKYIGFFGKASDAMVDLQLIADLHKSEVVKLSKLLNVPESIISATPRGDVWDNKVDEEMIGAPYWFIEMYQLMKEFYTVELINKLLKSLNETELEIYNKYRDAVEKIHSQNAHKYKVGSPARYINVIN